MKTKKQYQAIDIQVATEEGHPVMETITAEDQKEFIDNGYGSISDLINWTIESYRHWQCDC